MSQTATALLQSENTTTLSDVLFQIGVEIDSTALLLARAEKALASALKIDDLAGGPGHLLATEIFRERQTFDRLEQRLACLGEVCRLISSLGPRDAVLNREDFLPSILLSEIAVGFGGAPGALHDVDAGDVEMF